MKNTAAKRSLRRHHNERIKAKHRNQERAFYSTTTYTLIESEQQVKRREGMRLHTPKPCSCWMCGNPRKYRNRITFKEMNADLQLREEMTAFFEPDNGN